MGNFVEKITLENSRDRAFAESGYIKENQIRIIEKVWICMSIRLIRNSLAFTATIRYI